MFIQILLFFFDNFVLYIYYLVEFEALKSYVDRFDWLVLSFDFNKLQGFQSWDDKIGIWPTITSLFDHCSKCFNQLKRLSLIDYFDCLKQLSPTLLLSNMEII
jgi:hypothetical protein